MTAPRSTQPVYAHYNEAWGQSLTWWERVALLFQRVTLSADNGVFIATKQWRGTIYVVATGKMPSTLHAQEVK